MRLEESPNASDIGFSAPVKKGAALFVLGRVGNENSWQEDGGFGALWDALTFNAVFSNKLQKESLVNQLPALETASKECGHPVFLTTMGRPRLGLMPDLGWTESHVIPQEAIVRKLSRTKDPMTQEFYDFINKRKEPGES